MQIVPTKLTDVLCLTPVRHRDDRGFFSEVWKKETLQAVGIDVDFVQENHSLSTRKGTVRGLHLQTPPHAQAKLVRCCHGAILDVAVDIRVGSPSFGKWVSIELSAENGKQLFIPEGFAHGFITLTEDTEILYKCSAYYAPDCDRSIAHDDPTIGIEWGVSQASRTLSTKDLAAPNLSEFSSPFHWEPTT